MASPETRRAAPEVRPRRLDPDDTVFLGLLALGGWYAVGFLLLILVAPRAAAPDFDLETARPYLQATTTPAPSLPEPPPPAPTAPPQRAKREPPPGSEPRPSQAAMGQTRSGGRGVTTRLPRFETPGSADADLLAGLTLPQANPKGPPTLRSVSTVGPDREIAAAGPGAAPALQGPKVRFTVELVLLIREPEVAPPAGVADIVQRQGGALRACYESRIRSEPGLEGRVVLAWEVADGRAVDVRVEEDGIGDPALASCLIARVSRWNFRGATDGTARWPFFFTQVRR